MADKSQRQRGLGRGLSALMADVNDRGPAGETAPRQPDMMVPIERVAANPDQPRRRFDAELLNDLAASIREKGIIQPLIVRAKGDGYEIVAGERRWRAAQQANLHEIPVIIRDFDDTEVLEIAIIENIQRADLNPVEEAAGYVQLMNRFGHTQEKLAEALGKSRSHIANTMRLMQLPEIVQNFVTEGKLSAGHARTLITAPDPVALAKKVIAGDLSVRDTEKLVRKAAAPEQPGGGMTKRAGKADRKTADTRALEHDLSANLGMKVSVDHRDGSENGAITISYKTLDELDELCRILSMGK
ncbi:chromosome partitioning protein ParB [Pelagivirga sediminicola]|uniref:Chromosome partitioning protein ParB n=1 Tax=Pelagivirga sediminicola TaxID=2170575 RepID=A0A2T7G8M7_9RHOB|nr:ParB/RepB/Spo0J family partition protein [Pelagivirga sediminicola]PVA10779.1 chromosome partitioning protein ParB [Pelagivirga sediminicola]